jgi:arginine N-succinyltransferase
MFILRAVETKDVADLFELSQLITFINLPPDLQIIEKKVASSLKSFTSPSKNMWENHYLFVLEDLKIKKVVGASMIHAQHGTEDEPHFFLSVGQENKFSTTINTGFIHGTLKLGLETDGPTEIGGLILSPNYRNNALKLGKQLSFVRFLYMALYPERFKSLIHSELMPPFDKDGRAPLWEAIGRRFMNLEYHEADILSRNNKEFILSLYPSEAIYETLLPIEARNAIGKVGTETLPVKNMLERIGFNYTQEVDPFDGGPHYRALLQDITPVKEMFHCEIKVEDDNDATTFLIQLSGNDQPLFKACMVTGKREGNILFISQKQIDDLKITLPLKTYATPI